MKTVLCLLVTLVCYSSTTPSRIYYPEENDINYKRFQQFITKSGDEEVVDLLSEKVTRQAVVSDITYYVYTKSNLNSPHVIKSTGVKTDLKIAPSFDPKKKTYFIIHGWVDDYTGALNAQVKSSLFNKYDVNVVVVDWSPVAALDYNVAKDAVTNVGKFVGDFVNNMIDTYGISGSSITLIGHSLGAHIAGNAGAVIKSRVAHIIGLDPAAPLFTVDNTANRLDPTDAQYVQVIHTNGRFLGFSSSIGHADFYPNGGMTQAGCGLDLLGVCSHNRVIDYLAEAISNKKILVDCFYNPR